MWAIHPTMINVRFFDHNEKDINPIVHVADLQPLTENERKMWSSFENLQAQLETSETEKKNLSLKIAQLENKKRGAQINQKKKEHEQRRSIWFNVKNLFHFYPSSKKSCHTQKLSLMKGLGTQLLL